MGVILVALGGKLYVHLRGKAAYKKTASFLCLRDKAVGLSLGVVKVIVVMRARGALAYKLIKLFLCVIYVVMAVVAVCLCINIFKHKRKASETVLGHGKIFRIVHRGTHGDVIKGAFGNKALIIPQIKLTYKNSPAVGKGKGNKVFPLTVFVRQLLRKIYVSAGCYKTELCFFTPKLLLQVKAKPP